MSYKVTIVYSGPVIEPEQLACPICSLYAPVSSYIDTPVYREGYEVGAEAADKTYGKSVYATNHPGMGRACVPEPYATTSTPFPVPLAQFKVAVVGEYDEATDSHSVSFTVDDYKEAFWYKEMGVAMAAQGFTVTVEESSDSSDGTTDGGDGSDSGDGSGDGDSSEDG